MSLKSSLQKAAESAVASLCRDLVSLAETLSRRDYMKVARHEMPGARLVNARPGGYGVIGNPTHRGLY